ncbi:MAG: preprotein translocase subunit YajC [Gammaproteobacteria bacterium]|nr:MAG: preprotein translocase subunit YajC [Gammaproteobacteria bacterium]
MSFFVSEAFAEAGEVAGTQGADIVAQVVMLLGFVAIFYFLLWRPQSKRSKAQKTLLGELAKGDEVVTTGGILGKVTRLTDGFVVIQVSDNMELKFQKGAISASLPKGTIKAI